MDKNNSNQNNISELDLKHELAKEIEAMETLVTIPEFEVYIKAMIEAEERASQKIKTNYLLSKSEINFVQGYIQCIQDLINFKDNVRATRNKK